MTDPPDPESVLPVEVTDLLDAADQDSAERAWQALLSAHGSAILKTARRFNRDYDASMDAYAYVLEKLRADDFRRLRTFDGRAKLSTWLVVVTRSLCLDLYRQRYGRRRSTTSSDDQDTRRRLVDLVGESIPVTELAGGSESPDFQVRQRELNSALECSIERLDPRDRLLLALRFERDLSARVISEAMGFPSQFHVYRRLKHVLAGLRQALEDRGISDASP